MKRNEQPEVQIADLHYKIHADKNKLSKALNLSLKQVSADITLLTDQQVKYYSEASQIIRTTYEQYPDHEIICFRLNSSNDITIPHCHYPEKTKPFEQILFLNFYEISFKKSLVKKNIHFDEDFGAGTNFPFGESLTFIQMAINKGVKVHFSSKYIGQHPEKYLFTPADEINKLRSLGAIDYKMHGWDYVINYINHSVKKMEYREAKYGNGLIELNKMNAYLLGAKEFKDQHLAQINL